MGIQPPAFPCSGHPLTAATAPGCVQGMLHPASTDSIFLQLKMGEKRAGCSSATWQGFGDTGGSWRWTQRRHGRRLLHWDAAAQRTGEARGGSGGLFPPAVVKWELWEHHQDQEAAAMLGSTPSSSSQAEREPGHSVEDIMTLDY